MEKNKFIIKNEAMPTKEFQLSFDDLKSISENEAITSKIPYVDYLLLDGRSFDFPTKRFFIFSLLIHSALLATAVFYSLNPDLLPKTQAKEIITIDFEDSSKGLTGASAPVTESDDAGNDNNPVTTSVPHSTPTTTPSLAKTTPQNLARTKPAAKSEASKGSSSKTHSPAVKTFTANDSIDDIALPALSEVNSTDDSKNAAPNFDEIQGHLDDIDEQDNQKIVAANQELESLQSQQANQLDDISNEIQSEDSNLDKQAEDRKNQLSKQRQELIAAQAQTQAEQQAKKALATGKGHGGGGTHGDALSSSENGNGNSIGTSATATGSGSGDGSVRKLEDLRQMPGNEKPTYDNEERLKGLSGSIVLYGFVTKEGRLSQFKMIQSTGHRSLDKKTLVALKKWKFYPGQEGWVELPFKWDLKGGVQQKPTLLKRR